MEREGRDDDARPQRSLGSRQSEHQRLCSQNSRHSRLSLPLPRRPFHDPSRCCSCGRMEMCLAHRETGRISCDVHDNSLRETLVLWSCKCLLSCTRFCRFGCALCRAAADDCSDARFSDSVVVQMREWDRLCRARAFVIVCCAGVVLQTGFVFVSFVVVHQASLFVIDQNSTGRGSRALLESTADTPSSSLTCTTNQTPARKTLSSLAFSRSCCCTGAR